MYSVKKKLVGTSLKGSKGTNAENKQRRKD